MGNNNYYWAAYYETNGVVIRKGKTDTVTVARAKASYIKKLFATPDWPVRCRVFKNMAAG